jgi:hypothetical protein
MASQAIQALAKRAESARSTLTNMKERARIQEERVYTVAEVAGGGAVAGFVDGYWGKPEIFGMPAVPIIGVVLALVGLSGWVPGGMHVASFASGMVAGPLYELAARKGAEKAAQ